MNIFFFLGTHTYTHPEDTLHLCQEKASIWGFSVRFTLKSVWGCEHLRLFKTAAWIPKEDQMSHFHDHLSSPLKNERGGVLTEQIKLSVFGLNFVKKRESSPHMEHKNRLMSTNTRNTQLHFVGEQKSELQPWNKFQKHTVCLKLWVWLFQKSFDFLFL